jgi:hypothetical protein
MNYEIKLSFLLLFVPLIGFSMPNQDYWICRTQDINQMEWTAKSEYQKIALNLAFDACKKRSKNPSTCKASTEACEGFHLGKSTKSFWRCTALDRAADYWRSNYYHHKDDAIMAAKAYCKSKSSVPETCYVNVITCININEQ